MDRKSQRYIPSQNCPPDDLLLDKGQPQKLDRSAASHDLKAKMAGEYLKDDTVAIAVQTGSSSGTGTAWGCNLSYDYVKIH